jgi:hypothetical protein
VAYIDKDKIENSGSQTSGQGKDDSCQARQSHRQLLSSRVGVLRVLRSSQDSSNCCFSGVHHRTCSRPGIPRLGGLRASVVAWLAEATPWGSFEVSYCSLGSPLVLRSGYEWQGHLPPGRI